jgi:hypothetical protein
VPTMTGMATVRLVALLGVRLVLRVIDLGHWPTIYPPGVCVNVRSLSPAVPALKPAAR